jgi:anti-sigma regulatory factor (Ser/Thr protein kinase)
VPDTVLDDLKLLVSELVTNSVKHSGMGEEKPIVVKVEASGGRVRLEVADQEHGFSPAVRHPGPEVESGWGLYLVDQVADRWGQIPGDGVWAEIDPPSDGPHH